MSNLTERDVNDKWPTLGLMPIPAKTLATAILVVLAIGMTGALGQIIVHDIIPTFFDSKNTMEHEERAEPVSIQTEGNRERGDLFAELTQEDANAIYTPLYQTDQFVWLLRWTHIHLFGMNMIFIFLGGMTIFLNASSSLRAWLVVLPFAGVLIDITAMWLKAYVSSSFFWLHIPGGGLFASIFTFVCFKALREMWGRSG